MGSERSEDRWTWKPVRGYEVRGWMELWAGRRPVVVADSFTRTAHGETETHYGIKVSEVDAKLLVAAPDLLDLVEELLGVALADGVRKDQPELLSRALALVAQLRGPGSDAAS
jgi:hypothetical protein